MAELALNDIGKHLNQDVSLSGTIIPGTVKELEDGTISLQLNCELIKNGDKTFTTNGILRLAITKVPKNSKIRTLGYGQAER